jgi:Concanavalin A-like lectin/glucanases superfamily
MTMTVTVTVTVTACLTRLLLLVLLLLGMAAPAWAQSPSQLSLGAGIMRGLLGWWRALPGFTGGNTLYDISPYRNHGTLTNMGFTALSGWNLSHRPGGGMHLAFDGTDDIVQTGVNLSGGAETAVLSPPFLPFTYCAWVWQQDNANVEMHVISQFIASGTFDGPMLAVINSPRAVMLYLGTSTGNGATGTVGLPVAVPVQRWTHLCGTYDGSGNQAGLATYQDGQFVVAGTSATIPGTYVDRFLSFGGDYKPSPPGAAWKGRLDDMRVWRRALAAAEIKQVYLTSAQGDQELFQASAGQTAGALGGNPGNFFNFFR